MVVSVVVVPAVRVARLGKVQFLNDPPWSEKARAWSCSDVGFPIPRFWEEEFMPGTAVGPFWMVPVQLVEGYPVHVRVYVTPLGAEATDIALSANVVCAWEADP